MFKSHRLIIRTLAALAFPVIFVAQSASAATPFDESPPSVKVQYSDLNLNSPQGVAGLYSRINAAAAVVCEPSEGPHLLNQVYWTAWHSCITHAIGNAVQAVHNDNLSAYHGRRPR